MMVIVKGFGSPTLVTWWRKGKKHSKYYKMVCFCAKRHKRKDGTCKHTDFILNNHIKPEARCRVSVEEPERAAK